MIITIIVLLILAGVSISMVAGDNGILTQAVNSATETDISGTKEEIELALVGYYDNRGKYTILDVEKAVADVLGNETEIAEDEGVYTVETTKGNTVDISDIVAGAKAIWYYTDDTYTEVTNGTVTVAVGDYIDYDAGTSGSYTSSASKNGYQDQIFNVSTYTSSGYGWRILGADEDTGELLIISTDYIGPDSGGYTNYDRTYYYLTGQTAYVNAEDEINAICAIYGNGYGATGARSLTVEDVNKIAGYVGSEHVYCEGEIYEYGNEVTYTIEGGVIKYSCSNDLNGTTSYNSFTYYDEASKTWKNLSEGEKVTFTENGDYYDASEYILSDAYEMLFLNNTNSAINSSYANSTTGNLQWLAGSCVNCYDGGVDFSVPVLLEGYVSFCYVYGSIGYSRDHYFCGVRPIVYLESDISLIEGSDGWSIE